MKTHALTIPVDALEKGPFRLEGELPGSLLELDNEVSIRNIGPVSYSVIAERLNQEVLVRGEVEVALELECVRSGLFFSTTVRDSAFLRDYSLDDVEGDLDISEDVREALVIEIPLYPVSPEAQSEEFVPPSLPGNLMETADTDDGQDGAPNSPWAGLDDLNLKN